MKKNKHTQHNTHSGFTLLFAVLVSTLVISISATIISIALRQTVLSGTSRESQYAFYAANTALDCAHYWDTTNLGVANVFVFPAPGTTDIPAVTSPEISPADDIVCSGMSIIEGDGDIPGWTQDGGETTFQLKIKNQAGDISDIPPYEYCAEVTVLKTLEESRIITRIEAKGYNTCDANNPRRVERSLVQQYES